MGIYVGHIVGFKDIPSKCPGCGIEPLEVDVKNYDPVDCYADVVCHDCGYYVRLWEAKD